MSQGYTLSTAERNLIYKLKQTLPPICNYCEMVLSTDEVRIDHKTPVCRGGKTEVENLCVSCEKCNTEKSSKTEKEFALYLKYKNEILSMGYDRALEIFNFYVSEFRKNKYYAGYKNQGLKNRWKVQAIRKAYGI